MTLAWLSAVDFGGNYDTVVVATEKRRDDFEGRLMMVCVCYRLW